MKKLLSIILAVIISMSCVGCGTNGINKTVYESGMKALEVFDSYYFDMETPEKEAREKLDILKERVKDVDSKVYHEIFMMNICLLGNDEKEALEARNNLAKILGEETR